MRKHLAIFSEDAIEAIFKGQKKVESRFSQKRVLPFGQVSIGDLVYIKPPGKEVVGAFKVNKVLSFEGLEKEDWKYIKINLLPLMTFGKKSKDLEYLKQHSNALYATFMFIGNVELFIVSPIGFTKKDLRGWVIL